MLPSRYQSDPLQPLSYASLPDHTVKALAGFMKGERPGLDAEVERFRHVQPRAPDHDGQTEVLYGATFTHRFVTVPGDGGLITYHVVEAGPADAEAVLMLHGIPDSWYQWAPAMAQLAGRFRLIAPDLKGYGQSDKRPGDYTYAGTADEMIGLVDALGVQRFNLVTHDRGTVVGDHMAAKHAFRVSRYVRGEQQLAHYHPMLSPQEHVFGRPEPMRDPVKFIIAVVGGAVSRPVANDVMERTIQEYSYPGIADAVPRYFNSSSFTQEWIERRTRLMSAWRAPILLLQGAQSHAQPVEFYKDARRYIPNAMSVELKLIDAGHFWPIEDPEATTAAIETFLNESPAFDAAAWHRSLDGAGRTHKQAVV